MKMQPVPLQTPKRSNLGATYSEIYNLFFAQFPTVVCFEFKT